MSKNKLPKCILEKWVCCICGSDNTYIDPNGHYHWFNDYNNQGDWTGRHICHDCHYDIGKPRIKREYSNIICYICGGKETDKNFNGTPIWLKYPNKESWDKKSYMCTGCRGETYYRTVTKLDPDNYDNLKKAMRQCRMGNIDKDSEFGKAIISQASVAKVLGIKDLNILMNNYGYYIDMYHEKYKKTNVKFSILNKENKWELSLGVNRDYDTVFLLGSINGEGIDYIWIIPNVDMIDILGTTILRSSLGHSKYDKYRIEDSEVISYDNVYRKILLNLKDKKKFSIEDIKKWLE